MLQFGRKKSGDDRFRLLAEFIQAVLETPDTPSLIRQVAMNNGYMRICKRIAGTPDKRDNAWVQRAKVFCEGKNISYHALEEKLFPVARSLGMNTDTGDRDYYEILGVDHHAGQKEIKSAFRKKALKIHPDVSNGRDSESEEFYNLQTAYDVLSDTKSRKNYDGIKSAESWAENTNQAPPINAGKKISAYIALKNKFIPQMIAVFLFLGIITVIADFVYKERTMKGDEYIPESLLASSSEAPDAKEIIQAGDNFSPRFEMAAGSREPDRKPMHELKPAESVADEPEMEKGSLAAENGFEKIREKIKAFEKGADKPKGGLETNSGPPPDETEKPKDDIDGEYFAGMERNEIAANVFSEKRESGKKQMRELPPGAGEISEVGNETVDVVKKIFKKAETKQPREAAAKKPVGSKESSGLQENKSKGEKTGIKNPDAIDISAIKGKISGPAEFRKKELKSAVDFMPGDIARFFRNQEAAGAAHAGSDEKLDETGPESISSAAKSSEDKKKNNESVNSTGAKRKDEKAVENRSEDTEKKLYSFFDRFCRAYESENLPVFQTFFSENAVENGKRFNSLLPVYRNTFKSVESIRYIIRMKNFENIVQAKKIKVNAEYVLTFRSAKSGKPSFREGEIFFELEPDKAEYRVNKMTYFFDRKD